MNILILGSGGREHAFAWKIKQSPLCDKLYILPGNAGTAKIAQNINIPVDNFEEIGKFCLSHQIELVLVGPEVPLVLGVVDYFEGHPSLKGIPVIGPNKLASTLEGSKDFSKKFMRKYNIPTASYRTFTKENYQEGIKYLESHSLPIVLKADGLAAGKGVIISANRDEAIRDFSEMIQDSKFGEASSKVVVEQFLKGIELSVFVLTDGKNYKILPEAKDYKRIGEEDTGPNTGGMGAVSPVSFATDIFLSKVENQIIIPTIEGLKQEGIKYKGFIFFGLINVEGEPYVIEYNCRMGDPETEVVIPRIKTDFVELLQAVGKEDLDKKTIEFDERSAATVMLVAGGYPGDYEKGKEIKGLDSIESAMVFHAGTKINDQHKVVSNGGRVLTVTAYGESLADALHNSYKQVNKISWEGRYFRSDIGKDLLSLKYN